MCMTPHIEALKEDIAKVVIMPGDPLRAKFIAEKYLKDYRVVNTVRNMLAFTGYYNDKLVTVFASGMGIPSIGIYAYELYKFYDVETIIRIGTCGSFDKNVKMLDVVIADGAYSNSTFALMFNNDSRKEMRATKKINDMLEKKAQELQIPYHRGRVITSDFFDFYLDHNEFISHFPKQQYLAAEMEAFALFFLANYFNKNASCLLTVVDSYENNESVSSEDRQNSLEQMIELALKTL